MNLDFFPGSDGYPGSVSPRTVAIARVAIALLGGATPIAYLDLGGEVVSVGRLGNSDAPFARILVFTAPNEPPQDLTDSAVETWRECLQPAERPDRSAFGLAAAFVDRVGAEAALHAVTAEELFA